MTISPDTKDWTWVTERACTDCGFDPAEIKFHDIPTLSREAVATWQGVLDRDHDALATHPNDHTWSPLEYAAHVRDVCRIMLARINLVLVLDDPLFANWNQDDTAIEQRYNEQDPGTVSTELAAAGEAIAAALEVVPAGALERTGSRSDGAKFSLATLAPYFLHDIVHHLWDVGAVNPRSEGHPTRFAER